jgi:hypothetical protein
MTQYAITRIISYATDDPEFFEHDEEKIGEVSAATAQQAIGKYAAQRDDFLRNVATGQSYIVCDRRHHIDDPHQYVAEPF